MDDKTKAIVEGVGAIAEIVSIFYNTMVKSGIPKKDAVELAKVFIRSAFSELFNQA